LIDDELVLGKIYGKTTIYSIKQTTEDKNLEENMNNVTKSINELTEKLETIVADSKKLDQGKSSPFDDNAQLNNTYL
jgi:hypothetical protein